MIDLRQTATGVIFAVRVTPRSKHNRIEGEYQGALKIRLTAPPNNHRANDALEHLLADRLNVPISAVRIVTGENRRTKRIEVRGVERAQVLGLLNDS